MRAASLPGAVCAACLGFLSAQTSQLAPPVELGEPIERQMHGGEAHDYRLDLAAGQYVHVVVDQLGIDVIVSVFGQEFGAAGVSRFCFLPPAGCTRHNA